MNAVRVAVEICPEDEGRTTLATGDWEPLGASSQTWKTGRSSCPHRQLRAEALKGRPQQGRKATTEAPSARAAPFSGRGRQGGRSRELLVEIHPETRLRHHQAAASTPSA